MAKGPKLDVTIDKVPKMPDIQSIRWSLWVLPR